MSGRKEANETARAYRQAGYDVELAPNGHYRVTKDGRLVTTFAASPSTARSANEDRRKQGKILAGEELHDPRPMPEVEDHGVPAAFRSPSWHPSPRVPETLGAFNDIGDLFAEVTPIRQVAEKGRFREAFDTARQGKAERKLMKRGGSGRRKAIDYYTRQGWNENAFTGTCAVCLNPGKTGVIAPMSSKAEGYLAALLWMGMEADQAYFSFAGWWNKCFPYLPPLDMKARAVPNDDLVHGIPFQMLICAECWKVFQRAYPAARDIKLLEHPEVQGFVVEEGNSYGPDGQSVWEQRSEARVRLHRDLKAEWEKGQEE